MGVKNIFKRYELKFMLTTQQYIQLKELMKKYMQGDEFGKAQYAISILTHPIIFSSDIQLKSLSTKKNSDFAVTALRKMIQPYLRN